MISVTSENMSSSADCAAFGFSREIFERKSIDRIRKKTFVRKKRFFTDERSSTGTVWSANERKSARIVGSSSSDSKTSRQTGFLDSLLASESQLRTVRFRRFNETLNELHSSISFCLIWIRSINFGERQCFAKALKL